MSFAPPHPDHRRMLGDSRPTGNARASGVSRLVGLALVAGVATIGVAWFTIAGGMAAVAPSMGPGGDAAIAPATDARPSTSSLPAATPSLTSGTGSSSPLPVVTPTPSATDRPLDPEFGMSGHLMWHDVGRAIAQLDMLKEDGLGVVRFDVAWRGLEPERGRYAYLDKLDAIVDAAVARGIRPVITVAETPGWAN